MSASFGRWMLVVAGVIVAGTVAAAFMTMDTPGQVRDQRLDQRRVTELEQIAGAIGGWHELHGKLPASLAQVAGQPGRALAIRDPVDGSAYGYEPGNGAKYRLCAVFATDTAKRDPERDLFRYDDQRWPHPAGRHCFERKIETPDKPTDPGPGPQPRKAAFNP
jgi:hypothetical protein